jgi:hypothetical protein
MLWIFILASMTDAQFEDGLRRAPSDVRALAERWQGCNHWAGEEPYDKDRERQILAAVKQLRCPALAKDDAVLRRKYRSRHEVAALLDEAREAQ